MIFLRTVSRTKIGKKLKSGQPSSLESRYQTKNLNQSKNAWLRLHARRSSLQPAPAPNDGSVPGPRSLGHDDGLRRRRGR